MKYSNQILESNGSGVQSNFVFFSFVLANFNVLKPEKFDFDMKCLYFGIFNKT